MNTVMIVQARMTSTRLPGKVLKTVLDKPLLEYQVDRLKRVQLANRLVIATTTNETDLPIVEWCESQSIDYFRGSENDVLSRYYGAAEAHGADVIVRLTSDCPLIDPQVTDQVIQFYMDHQPEYHYVSNSLVRSYPRGMDTEVFSFQALHEAYSEANEPFEREHVTPFIYQRPERYRMADIRYAQDQSHHRWTVDTKEDLELIRTMLETLYPVNPYFTLEDALRLHAENPEWVRINQHIEQKKLGQ
jgi:spore coat polysaccharide biosynthesis protein SpsF